MEAPKVYTPLIKFCLILIRECKLENYCVFLSTIELKNINEALAYSDWIIAIEEELHKLRGTRCVTLYHD